MHTTLVKSDNEIDHWALKNYHYSALPSDTYSAMASAFISPADRIRELNDINRDVVAMLNSAGLAINALTCRPLDPNGHADNAKGEEDIAMCEEAFKSNTESYYTKLQSVVARLRRQTYALEEAKIILPEARTASSVDVSGGKITNGGLGSLDVGYLNSRGNKVGAEKEAELIDDVKRLLESEVGGMAG